LACVLAQGEENEERRRNWEGEGKRRLADRDEPQVIHVDIMPRVAH
jgi:hypothetical protein